MSNKKVSTAGIGDTETRRAIQLLINKLEETEDQLSLDNIVISEAGNIVTSDGNVVYV